MISWGMMSLSWQMTGFLDRSTAEAPEALTEASLLPSKFCKICQDAESSTVIAAAHWASNICYMRGETKKCWWFTIRKFNNYVQWSSAINCALLLPQASTKEWGSSTRANTVNPLIIESLWAKIRVSAGALGALDDPMWSKRKFQRAVEFL